MFLCLCNWMMDLHIWLNAGLWKLPLIITTKLLISMKLISGSVMVFKSIEFHAKNIKFRQCGSSGGNMPKIWCRLKKTIIEGVEAAQIFDRLLIKSLLQFYEAMSLSLHSAPLLLKVLIQIRSSLENVWIGSKLCRSYGATRIHWWLLLIHFPLSCKLHRK